ncbi:hypothetical protein FDP41_000813 [Naegleria fowleri]|uniref:DENND3-like TPR repeats domain-containing protein n=1 Tax=Naegleria fowleri TaxID=5763 RepID=A0A6A5CEA3_NAEFO|nr:uncharacterized protein FDP41_000813 [Naegleria fowleri]KAF0984914.1 hypothetical protein FDP41_000813 [Naegleria fowleri]
MCGSPISGPLLVLFYPAILAVGAMDYIGRLDSRIRANNEKVSHKWQQKRKEFKTRLLFRKQIKAENKLNKQLKKFNQGSTTSLQDHDKLLNESTEDMECKLDQAQQQTEDGSTTNEETQEDAILFVQRAVVRGAANEYEKALKDLAFAQELYPALKETYIMLYLEGFCYAALGQYLDAARSFKKAIQMKEEMTSDSLDKCLDVERKIFEIQTEMKHTYEKALQSIGEYAVSTRQYLHNTKEHLKNKLLGRGSKSQTSDSASHTTDVESPATVEKDNGSLPQSLISLEELYFRAGVAYYYCAYYSDSITYYTKAIELLSQHQQSKESSSLLASYYYNRGLSNYYFSELDHALNDFLNCTKLQQNIDALKMIAATYGRKGCLTEQSEYKKQAKMLNPLTKFVSVFHYRLLDENCTHLVFSYLPIYSLMLVGGTCRYWRELAMQNLGFRPYFEISFDNLINNVEKQVERANHASLKEKLFLPTDHYKSSDDLLRAVLNASFFDLYVKKENKKVILKEYSKPNYCYHYDGSPFHRFMVNVSSLHICYDLLFSSCVIDELFRNSVPPLEELVIFGADKEFISISDLHALEFAQIDFTRFTSLKKLVIDVCVIIDGPFDSSSGDTDRTIKLPESMEIVEYCAKSKPFIQRIAEHYPNFTFKEL